MASGFIFMTKASPSRNDLPGVRGSIPCPTLPNRRLRHRQLPHGRDVRWQRRIQCGCHQKPRTEWGNGRHHHLRLQPPRGRLFNQRKKWRQQWMVLPARLVKGQDTSMHQYQTTTLTSRHQRRGLGHASDGGSNKNKH